MVKEKANNTPVSPAKKKKCISFAGDLDNTTPTILRHPQKSILKHNKEGIILDSRVRENVKTPVLTSARRRIAALKEELGSLSKELATLAMDKSLVTPRKKSKEMAAMSDKKKIEHKASSDEEWDETESETSEGVESYEDDEDETNDLEDWYSSDEEDEDTVSLDDDMYSPDRAKRMMDCTVPNYNIRRKSRVGRKKAVIDHTTALEVCRCGI